MKLDKRACRHAANVPLHISLNAGVLYTERVKYLVTAAVKLLGGHRVLAVYFYECERLKANDRMPKWVVFQGKDTFATLERDAEGNVKWRDAMVQHLTDYYMGDFLQSCVFYKKAGCSYRCTACGEEFIGMPRIGITRSGEQRGICPACYEQVISVCRNCAIHKRLPSHRCQSFLPKSDERPCRIKEESMQELTFETILRLPQMELKKTLKAELKSRGYPITDKPGYLYAEGTIPVLLVAHMDTVHRQPVEQICYSADGAVAMSPQGIGGDDRCGVRMILQILRTTNCHVLFCEDEEVGCIGAKKFTGGSLRPQVNYIVELDRRGNNDAVFYRCDNPEFEDFVTSFGFETAGGSCSDISYIAPYLETAAVNISCGYYCEHQRHEYIHLEEIELNADRVAQMVTQQTEHFEYMEQQDSFFGGRAYQYSMWDTASERDTYKWLSPLPKEAKIKLGTAELILPHAKIDRQGKVHRYVPKLKAAVLTENAIAVMPDGKKARYDFQKAKCQKVMPLSRALEILNTI